MHNNTHTHCCDTLAQAALERLRQQPAEETSSAAAASAPAATVSAPPRPAATRVVSASPEPAAADVPVKSRTVRRNRWGVGTMQRMAYSSSTGGLLAHAGGAFRILQRDQYMDGCRRHGLQLCAATHGAGACTAALRLRRSCETTGTRLSSAA
jgi:hypothetical protein